MGNGSRRLAHYRGGAPSRQADHHHARDYGAAYVDRVLRWWRFYRWDPLAQIARFPYADPGAAIPDPRYVRPSAVLGRFSAAHSSMESLGGP